ncbi:MAG TPA: hypothetical protein VIN65_07000, partial [Candidatus Dormibacteraeota bacterium]
LDHLLLSPATASITAGTSQTYTATGYDQYDNSRGDVTTATTFAITKTSDSSLNGSCTNATCSATLAVAHTVTGTDSTKTGTASLAVTPAALDHLLLNPATASITAGTSQAYTATGYDQYNNSRGDVTSATTFTIAKSSDNSADGSCTGATCTTTLAVAHTVTGTDSTKTGTASLAVTPAAESKLAITSQPTSPIIVGGTVSVGVTVEDQFGNRITAGIVGYNDSISVALSSQSFTAGSTTLPATNGVATFSGLEIDSTAGSPYAITASDATTAPGAVTKAITNSIVVNRANTATTASSASATYGAASVTLSATVLNTSTPQLAVSEGAVAFTIKDSHGTTVGMATSSTVSSGMASASFNPFYPSTLYPNALSAGTYSIYASFGQTPNFYASNNNVQESGNAAVLTITPQAARVTYTGALFASTSSPTTGTATVTLSATVQDTALMSGDVRTATLTFVNLDSGLPYATLCTATGVGLVSTGDTTTGTGTCNWTANIGSQSSQMFTVGIVIGGNYVRPASADAVVTVSRPLTNFITGGGYVNLSSPGGQCLGAIGSRSNFGFNVKYNKGGTNLQGGVNIIVRSATSCTPNYSGPRVYQIKGNMITSLSTQLSGGTANNQAVFNGKAGIQDITDPNNIISVDGNASLQLNMVDNGTPGTNDTLGITLWNKSGGLWYSSDWTGTTTKQDLLGGGDLSVH